MNTFLRQESPGPCPWWAQVPQMWLLNNALISVSTGRYSTKTGPAWPWGILQRAQGGGAYRALQEAGGSHIKGSLSFVPSVFSVCAFPWQSETQEPHFPGKAVLPVLSHSGEMGRPPSPLCPQGLKHPSASYLSIEMQTSCLFSQWAVNTFISCFYLVT